MFTQYRLVCSYSVTMLGGINNSRHSRRSRCSCRSCCSCVLPLLPLLPLPRSCRRWLITTGVHATDPPASRRSSLPTSLRRLGWSYARNSAEAVRDCERGWRALPFTARELEAPPRLLQPLSHTPRFRIGLCQLYVCARQSACAISRRVTLTNPPNALLEVLQTCRADELVGSREYSGAPRCRL